MSSPARRTTLAAAGLTVTALVGAAFPLTHAGASSASPSTAKAAPAAIPGKPVGAQPHGHHGRVELTWAPTYMAADSQSYTEKQAVSMAKRFDIIAATHYSFQNKKIVAAMRKANPSLTLIAYSNATFVNSPTAYPNAWYAHPVGGGAKSRIRSAAFHTYLMNPGNKDWRKQATSDCGRAAKGYNGCLVDLLTMGIFSKGFVNHLPANPHTHQVYTQNQWSTQLQKLAREYSTRNPGKVIIGNSVSNNFRFFDGNPTSQPLVGALPGAQMEDFLRGAANPYNEFPSVTDWLQNINVIKTIEASGRTGVYSTKLWGAFTDGHQMHPSKKQVAQWQGYAMASFLMRANGHSYFAFTKARTKVGAEERTLPYVMPRALGKPLGHMRHTGGVYVRSFHNGRAIVNPTGSAVRVHLPHKLTDLQGHKVKSILMKAHTGNVFLRRAH